jgi:flagellar hook-associated protein 3 FlgL
MQKAQSDAEDVDVAEATINLQTQSNAYQAALMAVSKTSQRSLLDFLS